MREVFMIRHKRGVFSVFPLIALSVWLTAYALLMTQRAMETVRTALGVFVFSVLPPLAIFSVCAKMLVKTNAALKSVFGRLAPFLDVVGMSGGGFTAFLFGLFAGFPTGAAILAELLEKDEISEREAASLLPFCNQASVAFLFGTVGAMLNDPGVGFVFFCAQTVTAWICVCLTAGGRRDGRAYRPSGKRPAVSLASALTEAVRESAFSMIGVCGFVVFFSLLGTALADTLSACGLPFGPLFYAVAGGGLEISFGFRLLAEGSFSREILWICGGAFLGFGGISVFMQATERTEAFFFSPVKYFGGKIPSCMLCAVFSLLFGLLCERNDGKKLMIALSFMIFCVFYLLNYVKIKFFSKKCGKIKRNAV